MSGYRVKTVAELTGIPRNTLLAWERRYHLLAPDRTDSGYRLYSDREVAYLRGLKSLLDGGLSIGEAIGRLPPPGAAPGPAPGEADVSELWYRIWRPLLAFSREGAAVPLRRAAQLSFEEAVQTVWVPLLAETGRAWEVGEITVAQEHFVAGVVREQLVAMFRALDAGTGGGPRVAVTTVPDERHDIPALCLAVRMAAWGWRVTWLGADVPVGDLCAYLVNHHPDLLVVSAIYAEDGARMRTVARQLRDGAPGQTIVVFGGPGAQHLARAESDGLWVCTTPEALRERWERRGR